MLGSLVPARRGGRSCGLGVLGTLALAVACHASPSESPAIGDESTLAIEGPRGIVCGAVALSPDLAVTASHCVPGRIVHYATVDRGRVRARSDTGHVLRRDAGSDLAAFSATGLVPAELSRAPLDPERTTRMVAHVPVPWSGVIVHPQTVDEGFVHTERLAPGASGSGLFNDAGELVGVAIGNDVRSGYFASVPRISRLVRGSVNSEAGAPPLGAAPPDARPAVWHDKNLELEVLLDESRDRRRRIEARLRRYDAPVAK